VAVYEIRTFTDVRRSSLIMYVDCPNDLAAILVAREVMRRGQAVEVWRDDRLVYRVGSRAESADPKPNKREIARGSLFVLPRRARK